MDTEQALVKWLTNKQKDCLRLVHDNYSSKEIGRKLGISQYAVDQRLRTAARKLGVASRYEAARSLARLESLDVDNQTYHSMIYQTPHLANVAANATLEVSGGNRDHQPDTGKMLQDAQAAYTASSATSAPWQDHMISTDRVFQIPSSTVVQVAYVLVITIISLLAFAAVISGLEMLSRIH